MKNTRYLPLNFKLDRLPCLVIGGGKVAAHKVEMLLAAGCALTVVAPEIDGRIRNEVDRGLIRWLARAYAQGDCEGFHLVVAATPDEEVNRAVSAESRQKGIPVNVVDVPELCTVTFGAVWREGPLTVSVSTGGAAPFMAAAVRNRISALTRGMGEWVEAAGRFRTAVRSEVKDPTERNRLYGLFADRARISPPAGLPQSINLGDWLAWLNHTLDGYN
ncbi:MAG: bifunctional precorrin-2 dehydrogenase/sirohydrochlorin ferrochelatase [Acidobacteriia bacterium]|nr:bifunctional precorrin-2 dehydrogenase/sirohydrochlorin ferrochelatase [Terriglobia bacterium]